jgi:hypothetical protein
VTVYSEQSNIAANMSLIHPFFAGKSSFPMLKFTTIRFLVTILALCLLSSSAYALDDIETLIYRSRTLSLASDPYWRILLHYQDFESEIDDPKFFCAHDGKINSEHELEATIRLLFTGDSGADAARFTARYVWLKEKLGPVAPLNDILEREVDSVKKKFASRKMTVLFSDEYPVKLESSFGHVFLGVYLAEGTEKNEGSDGKRKILNYAGDTEHDSYLMIPFKGFSGMYKGYFSIQDYEKKVKSYGEGEKRAVWEYDLNLSPDEIYRIMLHLHELDRIYCDFFFLDENCSQKLLTVLQPGRPDVDLTINDLYLSPVETVLILKNNGFINGDAVLSYDPGLTDKVPPDKRHGYTRVVLSGGSGSSGPFCDILFSPMYNSMYDENPGMKAGFQLEMCKGSARYYFDENKFYLERASLFDIMVMDIAKGSGGLFSLKTGADRYFTEDRRALAFNTRIGYGFFGYGQSAGLFFGSLGLDFNLYREVKLRTAAGPGVTLGVSTSFFRTLKTSLVPEIFYYPGKTHRKNFHLRGSMINSIDLGRYCALNVNGSFLRAYHNNYWEVSSGLSIFF